jgi:hypothetical protein
MDYLYIKGHNVAILWLRPCSERGTKGLAYAKLKRERNKEHRCVKSSPLLN